MTKPDCPRCGDNRQVMDNGEAYWCDNCRITFEPDNETAYSNDPVRSAIHNEEAKRRNRRNHEQRRGPR